MCAKLQRRCSVLLAIREEALQEWIRAETLHDVRVAWGRLGGRTLLHRRGPGYFSELARRRRRAPQPGQRGDQHTGRQRGDRHARVTEPEVAGEA
jgi:hypothetical protein